MLFKITGLAPEGIVICFDIELNEVTILLSRPSPTLDISHQPTQITQRKAN